MSTKQISNWNFESTFSSTLLEDNTVLLLGKVSNLSLYFHPWQRQSTSTPLQSLVLLNDPQYIEASRVLSEKLIETNEDNPSMWIDHAFKGLVSRSPSSEEEELLLEIYQSELERFKEERGL